MPSVGESIPEFELNAFYEGDIRKIKLSDYRGKWLVMLFYPADFTFVCPTELEEAAGLYDEFRNNNAEVLSISVDSAYAHKAWHEKSEGVGKIKYPMLSDMGGKLSKACGTYLEEEGVSIRASFIVDPDGIVKALEMHDNSIGRSTRNC